ncbi:hypothetical protein L1887_62345 [Cichorium endivia]|nr:hypothetical protein L1887_62345 [Cichorium endivia]
MEGASRTDVRVVRSGGWAREAFVRLGESSSKAARSFRGEWLCCGKLWETVGNVGGASEVKSLQSRAEIDADVTAGSRHESSVMCCAFVGRLGAARCQLAIDPTRLLCVQLLARTAFRRADGHAESEEAGWLAGWLAGQLPVPHRPLLIGCGCRMQDAGCRALPLPVNRRASRPTGGGGKRSETNVGCLSLSLSLSLCTALCCTTLLADGSDGCLECTQSDDAIHHHHHGAAAAATAAAAGGRFSGTTRSRAIGRQIFPIFDTPTGGGKSKGGPGQGDAVRCISGPNTCQKAIQIGDGW